MKGVPDLFLIIDELRISILHNMIYQPYNYSAIGEISKPSCKLLNNLLI